MVSLLLGLGSTLFQALGAVGIDAAALAELKGALLFGGVVWSGYIGFKLLARQGVPLRRRLFPLFPGVVGSLAVAAVWYPAILAS